MSNKPAKRKGFRLTKRKGSPFWYIRGHFRGRAVFESTGTADEEAARIQMLTREAELRQRGEPESAPAPVFADAVILYLPTINDDRYIDKLIDQFGQTLLSDMNQRTVDLGARRLYPHQKDATRLRAVYKPVKAILRHAAKHGLCAVPLIDSPKVKEPKIVAAGDAYIDRLWPHLSERIRPVVLIATDNSIRTSEILSMEWKHVDLARAEAEIGHTKNDDPFLLALTERTVIALANIPTDQDGKRIGKVFKFSRNVVNRDLAKARTAAGLPYMKLHQIGRHTFAERLLKHGHTLNTVMQAGNWKDIRVVSKNYGHLERGLIHDIVRNPKGKVVQ